MHADLLIHAGWVLPIAPSRQALVGHSVAVTGGAISAILPREQAQDIAAGETLDLPHHALMPGLVNCHGHAAMSLLRGFADDLPLMPWLHDHIWPAEAAHVSEQFVSDGATLAMAEMVRSGTTTFGDMYFFPDAVAAAANRAGMRCQLSFPILDFPSAWGRDADEYISKGLALRDDYKHNDRVHLVFGPHSPYTLSEANLAKVSTLAAELDVPVHIHLHETRGEVLQAIEQTGERPLVTLNRLGLLGPRTQCVHMTDLTDDDIKLLALSGAQVIHCPQSNMKLASGIAPITALASAGVNVALGTDGAASNNDLNLFGEMQAAALLAKVSTGDATALSADDVLHMATLGGATALGMESVTGSLELGKQADMIAVDMSGPETQPLYHLASQLVYSCNGSQVTHSWVNGKPLMLSRQLQTIPWDSVQSRVATWQQRIQSQGDTP